MTVQELIDELLKIPEEDRDVQVALETWDSGGGLYGVRADRYGGSTENRISTVVLSTVY
jgi:hypothetical protein